MKLGKLKITKRREVDEPNSCEYWGCKEDLNGLNHLMIKPFRKFCFDIWLCDEHLELFKKKLEDKRI
jgi:hypothetical protein